MLNSLTNNQILKSVITDAFLKNVEKNLIPTTGEKWGSSDIFMYEDHLKEQLLIDGRWYYPLTVLSAGGPSTQWISWEVTAADFKDKNPYAFIGDGDIDFELCDMPESLREKFSDYIGYSGAVGIEISVEAVARDITFLSGRYSQRFIDEMSRQITAKIETLMSCEGLGESSLSLLLAFAPESYFEHTSENVTYRRLLLIDKGSQPRDLWIRWTRLNSAVGYSVSDSVGEDDIEFDLGEDVPQKIREKEYRFLLREGRDKYQNAMGRKNVTEWREIIRRAIKRGELQKVIAPVQEIVFDDDISAKLKDILGDSYNPEQRDDVVDEAPMGDDYIKALEIAKGLVDTQTQDEDTSEIVFPEENVEFDIFDLDEVDEAPAVDIFELTTTRISEPAPAARSVTEDYTAEIDELPVEIEEQPSEVEEQPSEPTQKVTAIDNLGEASMKADDATTALREAETRATELSIRLEYEKQMRERIEGEVERLRQSEARLIEENNRLKTVIKADEAKYRAAEESFKLEIARLTAQNEVLTRSEERQKERLASAARDAVERQKLLEEEKRRIAEENARLEREKEKAQTSPEPAPIAESASQKTEEAPASEDSAQAKDNYTYVTKKVKLLFRRSVDPNITGRIYEIIKATLEYFGKEKMNLRIKASVPDTETVNLEFTSIPMEEMQLLSNIIQVLGSSGLGIAKAIVE